MSTFFHSIIECMHTPWSDPPDPDVLFPLDAYEKLLSELGWSDPSTWLNHWLQMGAQNLAYDSWPLAAKSDWLWGLGLPFLTDLENQFRSSDNRVLYGISGLPGCGKTSLGRWLKAAAYELHWPLTVVSMDDFYLPGTQLDKAMSGNPWNVPRALPGSHSLQLLEDSIETWLLRGDLVTPKFDKSLRNGRGDRCGWIRSRPKVLVIEGWFLGCSTSEKAGKTNNGEDDLLQSLTNQENEYRELIQNSLRRYQKIWCKFKRIWHIKAIEFNSTINWKKEQEMNLLLQRGSALQGESLESFLRMIQTAIPQSDLMSIEADFLAKISPLREIMWVGCTEKTFNT